MEGVLSDPEIAKISKRINTWELLSPRLGITSSEEGALKRDYSNYDDQKTRMLFLWRRKKGSDATWSALARACEDADEKDLAEEIKRKFKHTTMQKPVEVTPTYGSVYSEMLSYPYDTPIAEHGTTPRISTDGTAFGAASNPLSTGSSTGLTTGVSIGLSTSASTGLSTSSSTGLSTSSSTGASTGLSASSSTGASTGLSTGLSTGSSSGAFTGLTSTGSSTGSGLTTGSSTGSLSTGSSTGSGLTTGASTGLSSSLAPTSMSTGMSTGTLATTNDDGRLHVMITGRPFSRSVAQPLDGNSEATPIISESISMTRTGDTGTRTGDAGTGTGAAGTSVDPDMLRKLYNRYSADINDAIKATDPLDYANRLKSASIIDGTIVDQISTTLGLSRLQQVTIVSLAVETKLRTVKDPSNIFIDLCVILNRYTTTQEISKDMMSEAGLQWPKSRRRAAASTSSQAEPRPSSNHSDTVTTPKAPPVKHDFSRFSDISRYGKPNLVDLLNWIVAEEPSIWNLVGTELGITPGKLRGFQADISLAGNPKLLFKEVLVYWQRSHCKPYNWQTILDALASRNVDQSDLALMVAERLNRRAREYTENSQKIV